MCTSKLELEPLIAKFVANLGRPTDDPELIAFLKEELGVKRFPKTMEMEGALEDIELRKHHFSLGFYGDLMHEAYPPRPVSEEEGVAWLGAVWLGKGFATPLPFGLRIGMSDAELEATLGQPMPPDPAFNRPRWSRPLDLKRHVVLEIDRMQCDILIRSS